MFDSTSRRLTVLAVVALGVAPLLSCSSAGGPSAQAAAAPGISQSVLVQVTKVVGNPPCRLTVTPTAPEIRYYADPWNHTAETLQASWYLSAAGGGFGVQSTDEIRIVPKSGIDPGYFTPDLHFTAQQGGVDSGNAQKEPPGTGYRWSYTVEYWRSNTKLCQIDPDLIIRKGPGTIGGEPKAASGKR